MSLIPIFPTLIPGILPPSRETWELSVNIMKWLPVPAVAVWFVPFFGMGKHSIKSRLNLPGKLAWVTMEIPTIIVSSYVANTLPKQVGFAGGFNDLPGTNKLIFALFILHYLNRAVLTPIWLTPSMAPIHFANWAMAVAWNTVNGMQIGGWVAGYGITDNRDWAGSRVRIQVGLMLFCLGLFSNIMHEDELREIRRKAKWEQEQKVKKGETKPGEQAERVYKIPQALGFAWIFYPHYLSEWIEWAGFWMIGGASFVPARSFVVAEIMAMLPQTLQGRRWYIERFGKENVGDRKAVIPYLL